MAFVPGRCRLGTPGALTLGDRRIRVGRRDQIFQKGEGRPMVVFCEDLPDVVLFSPSRSLLLQLAGCAGRHRDFALRLVYSQLPSMVGAALRAAAHSIIDATDQPDQAMATLSRAVEQFGRGRITVYTEIMHEGLEVFARSRGAPLLLGPMSQEEWARVLDELEPRAAPVRAHRATGS
jgi:hypothetical protein